MAAPSKIVRSVINQLTLYKCQERLRAALSPRSVREVPLLDRLPTITDFSDSANQERVATINKYGTTLRYILPESHDPSAQDLAGNIEIFIGFAKIPIAVIGPLRVNGTDARGDFHMPLATSEGALAASYRRRFNLSDIFEYLSLEHGQAICNQLIAVSEPGARLAYWIVLAPRQFSKITSEHLIYLEQLSRQGFSVDKAFFYNTFIVEEVGHVGQ